MALTAPLTLEDTKVALTSPNRFYTFFTNPNTLTFSQESVFIENSYLRSDKQLYKPVAINSRRVTGKGILFDGPVNGVKSNKFTQFFKLTSLQEKKKSLRFNHSQYGSFFIVIQSLSATESPSSDRLEFDFTFIETLDEKSITFVTPQISGDQTLATGPVEVINNLQGQTYTVQVNDSLWRIAQQFYKDGTKWNAIYSQNTSVIEDAAKAHGQTNSRGGSLIYAGTVLFIPNVPVTNVVKSTLPNYTNPTASDVNKNYVSNEKANETKLKQTIVDEKTSLEGPIKPEGSTKPATNYTPSLFSTYAFIIPYITDPIGFSSTIQKQGRQFYNMAHDTYQSIVNKLKYNPNPKFVDPVKQGKYFNNS